MPYAIMRCKKLKGMGSVAGAAQHMFRERETANADPARTPGNEHMAARSSSEAMGKLRERLPEKRRKDAVLAVEYMMSASPEWWDKATPEQQADWAKRSREWLEGKYGKDNVLACTIHRDETSPHMTALVVPLTRDGRLSAKDFIGGADKLKDDQSTYAKAVAHLGLSRGVEGSKAKHQSIQAYYGRVAAAEKLRDAIPERMPPPLKPTPAPEPQATGWRAALGLETPEQRAWKAAEAKKAEKYQERVKAWRKADQERTRMVEALATKAAVLTYDARAGQDLKQKNVKLSAAAEKAQQSLDRILATPGVAEAVEAHKARQDAQGRAQAAEAAKEGKAFDQSLAARQQAEKEAQEPKPRPSRSRDLDNDGPSFGR